MREQILSGRLDDRTVDTFVGVACVLAIVSALACWMPAHRAMRVDPLVALRAD